MTNEDISKEIHNVFIEKINEMKDFNPEAKQQAVYELWQWIKGATFVLKFFNRELSYEIFFKYYNALFSK